MTPGDPSEGLPDHLGRPCAFVHPVHEAWRGIDVGEPPSVQHDPGDAGARIKAVVPEQKHHLIPDPSLVFGE
jgi:hypothetical protein